MTHHALRLTSKSAISIVGIDEAPLLIDPTGEGLTTITPINPWLREGINQLTIFLGEKPLIDGTPPPAPVFASAKVYTIKPDSDTSDVDRELAHFEISEQENPVLPLIRVIPFKVSEPPPVKLWLQAKAQDAVTEEAKRAILAILHEFQDAVEKREVEPILRILDFKTTDSALANAQDAARMRKVIESQYLKIMFPKKDLKVLRLPDDLLNFKLICRKQIVWLFHDLKNPAFVAKAENARFTIPLFFAQLGNGWQVVR